MDAICHAGFKPGESLSKNGISRLMGISRTPVGQAIQRLEQEGLVEVIPGRTIVIAAPSLREVLDAIDIRERLEPWMVSLVAEKQPPALREPLEKTLAAIEVAAQEDDRSAWSRADTVYHELLSTHCPNDFLGEIIMQARNRVLRTLTDDYTSQQYIIDGTAEHRRIAEAILEGRATEAEQMVRTHLHNVRENMLKRVLY